MDTELMLLLFVGGFLLVVVAIILWSGVSKVTRDWVSAGNGENADDYRERRM